MSSFKKILEGVNEFMEKILSDGTPLSAVDATDLDRERQARQALRSAHPGRAPEDNPVAKLAAAGEEARGKRRELQQKRSARIEEEARNKEEAKKRAQDEEFRRVVEQARQQQASGSRPRPDAGTGSGPRRPPVSPFGKKTDIEAHYKTLDLPYGASFEEVKKAYRKLMRKYHPDLHNTSPKKHKAATELSVQVTQAYNALEKYLEKK